MAENQPNNCQPVPAQIATVIVNTSHISVPEYYTQPIPDVTRAIYDAFKIRYVQVVSRNITYYIYEGALNAVVSRLNLYV